MTHGLSKPYFRKILIKLQQSHPENANIICKYIIAEQAEINIKNSTKVGKIRCLCGYLTSFDDKKRFQDLTKDDVLEYLKKLRKPPGEENGWINFYNNRQKIFLKFFKGYLFIHMTILEYL